ncbi:MAG: hypothetical protein WKF88_09030 [Ferruginibacter sp.]
MVTVADSERRRKALLYTAIICGALLLLFILISWKSSPPPPPPPLPDEIEVNLGNNEEGFGEVQPLVKGDRSPEQETAPPLQPSTAKDNAEEEKVRPDDNAEDNAAPIAKAEKKIPKAKTIPTPAPVVTPIPKPQKPKIVYNGPGKGNGNNATQDNGYTMQGNKPGGKGDVGDPKGDKDSYGNTPGGKIGGPRVISGNRKVIRYYSFTGDLPKATVNAIIKVSPSGTGSFSGFGKGSTATGRAYADAISGYLRNMQFDKATDESVVTVQFNFNVQ